MEVKYERIRFIYFSYYFLIMKFFDNPFLDLCIDIEKGQVPFVSFDSKGFAGMSMK